MLTDFIDIHSHTLWGIDDGAQSVDETVAMCFCAEDNKTKTLFLTPHLIYWDKAEELCDKRDESSDILKDILSDEGSELEIKKGFEILCDDEIFSVKHFLPYTLNESRYILIEFDFRRTSEADVTSWCKYLKSFGLVPIIAHPERYGFVMDDITCIERLSDLGALFQINAGSPAGMFGPIEEDVACNILNNGYADFIGSDAHRFLVRNSDMLSLFEEYPYEIDIDLLERAAVHNPKYILEDRLYLPIRTGSFSKK